MHSMPTIQHSEKNKSYCFTLWKYISYYLINTKKIHNSYYLINTKKIHNSNYLTLWKKLNPIV